MFFPSAIMPEDAQFSTLFKKHLSVMQLYHGLSFFRACTARTGQNHTGLFHTAEIR